MGRSSFLQNIHLNLQGSGSLTSDEFEIPLLSPCFWGFCFLLIFTAHMFSFSVVWLLQTEDSWRKRKSAYLWVTVSAFRIAWLSQFSVALWWSWSVFNLCCLISSQSIQRAGIQCGPCQGNELQTINNAYLSGNAFFSACLVTKKLVWFWLCNDKKNKSLLQFF